MEEVFKSVLTGSGVAGGILAYHLLQLKPLFEKLIERVERLEQAQHTSNTVDLMRMIASPHVSPEVKEHASAIVEEIKKKQLPQK